MLTYTSQDAPQGFCVLYSFWLTVISLQLVGHFRVSFKHIVYSHWIVWCSACLFVIMYLYFVSFFKHISVSWASNLQLPIFITQKNGVKNWPNYLQSKALGDTTRHRDQRGGWEVFTNPGGPGQCQESVQSRSLERDHQLLQPGWFFLVVTSFVLVYVQFLSVSIFVLNNRMSVVG